MQFLKSREVVIWSSIGLILITACTDPVRHNSTQNWDFLPESQVIEKGEYSLRFLAQPESDGTQLYFYLRGGEYYGVIPDVKVTAQVELPTGEQTALEMEFNQEENHYSAFLTRDEVGDYQVAILSEVDGKNINGLFKFQR